MINVVDTTPRNTVMETSQSSQQSKDTTAEASATSSAIQDSTAVPSALTEFTLFPKLPIEIRLKIFRHALPVGPRGVRVLKVAAVDLFTVCRTRVRKNAKKAREEMYYWGKTSDAGSYLTFRLLKHKHSVYFRDVSLLSASTESRSVYLEYFTNTLETGGDGLIRFAMQDIVYIANFDVLVLLPEMESRLEKEQMFDGIRCRNLALPTPCFHDNGFEGSWDPFWDEDSIIAGQYIKFCDNCEGLEVVGAMLDDLESVLDDTDRRRHDELLWRKDTKARLNELKKFWDKSEAVRNEEWTPLGLSLWDHEGVRLELECVDGQTSKVS